MSPEARKANVDAKKYHQQRQSETAHSFDELEFDYPTVNEPIDPENAYVTKSHRTNPSCALTCC